MGEIQKYVQTMLLILLSASVPLSWTLSDFRLCRDENCREIISLGTAKVTYNAGEVGMVSIKINSPVRIMSKSAGSDPSLWGVEVNGRTGYVPKEYIKESKIIVSEKNLKFVVPVVTSQPSTSQPSAVLNASESEAIRVETESTTTAPLPLEMSSPSAIVTDLNNASSEEAPQGSPVQQTVEVVDGTEIPVFEESTQKSIEVLPSEFPKVINQPVAEDYNDDEDYDDEEESEEYDNIELQESGKQVVQPFLNDQKAKVLPENITQSQNVSATDRNVFNEDSSAKANEIQVEAVNPVQVKGTINAALESAVEPAPNTDVIFKDAKAEEIKIKQDENVEKTSPESKLAHSSDAIHQQLFDSPITDQKASNGEDPTEKNAVSLELTNETKKAHEQANIFEPFQQKYENDKEKQHGQDAYKTHDGTVTARNIITISGQEVKKKEVKVAEQKPKAVVEENAESKKNNEKLSETDGSKVNVQTNHQESSTAEQLPLISSINLNNADAFTLSIVEEKIAKPDIPNASLDSVKSTNRIVTSDTNASSALASGATSEQKLPFVQERNDKTEDSTLIPETTESGYFSEPADDAHLTTTVPTILAEHLKTPTPPTADHIDKTLTLKEHNQNIPEVQSPTKIDEKNIPITKEALVDETTEKLKNNDISTQLKHETDKIVLEVTEDLISPHTEEKVEDSQTPNLKVPHNIRREEESLKQKIQIPVVTTSSHEEKVADQLPTAIPQPTNDHTFVQQTPIIEDSMKIESDSKINEIPEDQPIPKLTANQEPRGQFYFHQNPSFMPTDEPMPITQKTIESPAETNNVIDAVPGVDVVETLTSKEPLKTHQLMEPTSSDKGLFSTILGTVHSFWQSDKKDVITANELDPFKDDELERILFSEQNVKKSVIPKAEVDVLCEKACTKTQCNFENMLPIDIMSTITAKMFEMSELLMVLTIVAATTLFFIFGYYCFFTSSREGALLAKLNLLERSLLASHKENIILRHDLTQTCNKLSSIEDTSFGSNDMVASLKQEITHILQQNEELKKQVTTQEKDLKFAADAGLELNKIVSELLNNQTGEETILKSVDELQTQLNEQQSTIMEINKNLAGKSRENSELQLIIAEQSARLGGEIASLQQENEELELEKGNLQTRLEELKNEFEKDITRALQGKNVEIERLQIEITESKEKCEHLYTKWQTSLAKIDALEECLQTVRKDPKVNITEVINVAHIRGELLDLQRRCSSLQDRLDAELDSKRLVDGQLRVAVVEVDKLKLDFNQAEKDKLEAQTRLEVLSNYFKEKEIQLQKELSLKEAQWLQQQGATTNTVEQLTTMQTEIQVLKSQNDALRAEIDAQMAAHKAQTGTLENRAHETWLAARQSERKYEEARADAAALRRKLTILMGAKTSEATRPSTTKIDATANNNLNKAPSPIPLETPNSPLFRHLPPPPPFLPPPFMPPPPPFMGMPPPPFLPSGEMRPAPLGRLMSPTPLRAGRYSTDRDYGSYYDYDDDDETEYERNHRRRRHSGVYSPNRSYRSHSPADSRYDYNTDRELMSTTYDTEYDSSPTDRGRRGSRSNNYKPKSPQLIASSPINDKRKIPAITTKNNKDAQHYRGHGRYIDDSGSASGNSEGDPKTKRAEATW